MILQVFALAGQTGYVYNFYVFGDTTVGVEEQLEAGIGASGQTVLTLLKEVPEGSEVFFDNYFASPALLLKLK